VAVEPESAAVTIELERATTAQFPVNPSLVGAPASGFDVGAVRVDPRIVTVTAPLEVLRSIDTSGIGTTEIRSPTPATTLSARSS
jgi:YbbR domain-containing protein